MAGEAPRVERLSAVGRVKVYRVTFGGRALYIEARSMAAAIGVIARICPEGPESCVCVQVGPVLRPARPAGGASSRVTVGIGDTSGGASTVGSAGREEIG
jgi:hypothetical protein